jgi:hypothetical protein
MCHLQLAPGTLLLLRRQTMQKERSEAGKAKIVKWKGNGDCLLTQAVKIDMKEEMEKSKDFLTNWLGYLSW